LDWTLLDRAPKAGKAALNGGTPAPAPPTSLKASEAHLAYISGRHVGGESAIRPTGAPRRDSSGRGHHLTHGGSGDPQAASAGAGWRPSLVV